MKNVIANLDELYQQDIANGTGFIIDTPIPVTKKDVIRNPRGIYSSLFGGDITDVAEIQKRYSCTCGETVGKFRSGLFCPKCQTPVTYQNNELDRTGWMALNEPYFVINPKMYKFLEKVLKAKRLDDILKFDRKLDRHGVLEVSTQVDPKNPYSNIGMLAFRERFDEILDNLADKKRQFELKFIMDNRDKIFVSHIPVLTLLLRPVILIGATTFNYDSLNKQYSEMISHVDYINNNIDNSTTYTNLTILYELQKKFNETEDDIIKLKLNGKSHTIRSNVLGSRINFSARHVLVPNTDTVQMDSIVIPYLTFVEFYKFHIMNIYKKLYNVTMNELLDRWFTLVQTQDPSIMNIIKILINKTDGGMQLYDNRNPTIALGSTTAQTLIGINEDIDDLTMSLPLNILPLKNADFDGDTLNNVPIIEKAFADEFKKYFSPQRMIISAATGKFNNQMNLLKDQLVGIYSFCNDDFDADDNDDPNDGFSIINQSMLITRDAYYAQMSQQPVSV